MKKISWWDACFEFKICNFVYNLPIFTTFEILEINSSWTATSWQSQGAKLTTMRGTKRLTTNRTGDVIVLGLNGYTMVSSLQKNPRWNGFTNCNTSTTIPITPKKTRSTRHRQALIVLLSTGAWSAIFNRGSRIVTRRSENRQKQTYWLKSIFWSSPIQLPSAGGNLLIFFTSTSAGADKSADLHWVAEIELQEHIKMPFSKLLILHVGDHSSHGSSLPKWEIEEMTAHM